MAHGGHAYHWLVHGPSQFRGTPGCDEKRRVAQLIYGLDAHCRSVLRDLSHATGRRKWYLLPPAHATYAQEHVAKRGLLDPASRAHAVTCVQEPGEVLFVPYGWSASSKYLEPSIGFVTGFTHDRLMVGGSRE